ncbi:MAG TPA: hypothetical protein VIR30_02695 [Nocardioides sp.]
MISEADDGRTDDELQQELYEQSPGSVSKRRCDLARAGLVTDSGRTRKTRRHVDAIVWVASDG